MVILGISGGFNHDSAACLIVDGKLMAMAEEERFLRSKKAFNAIPTESSTFCLNSANISPEEVDYIAVSWDPSLFKKEFYNDGFIENFKNHKYFEGRFKTTPVEYIPHHIAHAASSYFISGLDEAVVLVIDGHGENVSTSLGYCKGNDIHFDVEYPISHSLGHFYENVCEFIGLGRHSTGKMMGLAPYGKDRGYFDDIIEISNGGYRFKIGNELNPPNSFTELNPEWWKILYSKFGSVINEKYVWDVDNFRTFNSLDNILDCSDIAASAQSVLERAVLDLISHAFSKYNTRNLVMAGGVALNCSMNGKIVSKLNPDKFFVCPAAGDAGGALGAAAYLVNKKIDDFTPYLGPKYDNDQIKRMLDKYGIKYRVSAKVSDDAAVFFEQKKVIGVLQGAMEIGPRALGHRSILALPVDNEMRNRVNIIKSRELWRPLSPSMINDNVDDVFDYRIDSQYMLEAHSVSEQARNKMPGVVHVDNSCRPQIVYKNNNDYFYDILKEVYKRTGIPSVLNTSFNNASEPIVLSIQDSLRTFYSTGLDALIVEEFIIEKK